MLQCQRAIGTLDLGTIRVSIDVLVTPGHKLRCMRRAGTILALPGIFDRVAAGTYRPVVHEALPLSEIVRAHTMLEECEVVGKLVLVPGS